MNQLETRMTKVATWLERDPYEPLGDERCQVLRSWAIKTHVLLCFIDGNAGRFGDESLTEEYVVPPATPARQLYEGGADAVEGAVIGLARSHALPDFAWAFGFPTVKAAPGSGNGRFAPATALTLGTLQIWVTAPLLDARVRLPARVSASSSELRPIDLQPRELPLQVDDVRVAFS
jgi:hypothetical protein